MNLPRAFRRFASPGSPPPSPPPRSSPRSPRRRRTLHHRGLDHLHGAVGPLQGDAAGLHEGHRHRGARRRAGHRPGARHGPARRRRRGVRARQGRRGQIRRRRLRREALRGDVQRLHRRGPEVGPGRREGQGHPRGPEEDRGGQGAVRLARRQERHARRGASLLEGRRHRPQADRAPGTARRAPAWARRSTPPPR